MKGIRGKKAGNYPPADFLEQPPVQGYLRGRGGTEVSDLAQHLVDGNEDGVKKVHSSSFCWYVSGVHDFTRHPSREVTAMQAAAAGGGLGT